MTNHIEQLMKAAGVDRLPKPCSECEHYMDCGSGCQTPYPAFTPEKQLELIKLIGKKHRAITYIQCSDYCAMQVNPVSRAFGMYYEAESFEEVIVITILELLKVNELDKSEVKRILEDD